MQSFGFWRVIGGVVFVSIIIYMSRLPLRSVAPLWSAIIIRGLRAFVGFWVANFAAQDEYCTRLHV